ncbi:DUF1540 domain-containing protein [Thiorhodococcus minor]
MPAVCQCGAAGCAYNVDESCHAKAITIGDGVHPSCDTCLNDSAGQTHRQIHAGVGACKVMSCSFNDDLACTADHIAHRGRDPGALSGLRNLPSTGDLASQRLRVAREMPFARRPALSADKDAARD